jgi:hypothetical protein
MNDLLPPPYDRYAYGSVCALALAMAVFIVFFVSSHCEWVYETTHIEGACGLGGGWMIFALGFLIVAAYAGWEYYRLLHEVDL